MPNLLPNCPAAVPVPVRKERNWGFSSVNVKNVMVETVKRAQDSDAKVIRVYECFGRREQVELKIGLEFTKAMETNLLERYAGNVEVQGDTLKFEIKPYEIRTFVLE